MKKLLVVAVVALLALALVACGGETATTTKGETVTTTAAPTVDTTVAGEPTTTTPAVVDTTAPTVDTTVVLNTDVNTPDTAPAQAGIDIMNGAIEDMAIDPTWKGLWPCAFENHHPELNYKWCLVVKMLPTENCIQEELIAMDPDTGFGIAFEDYTWTLTIDGVDFVIDTFNIPQRDGFIYIRMGLGDWAPIVGEHEYDIKLTITDAATKEVLYWAYFTDPYWGGPYYFEGSAPIEMIPTEKPADVEQVPTSALTGISGPDSLAATETYVKLFDGQVRSKFCSSEYGDIIFTVKDASSIRGISLVGANDDEKFPERVPVKFKLYGSDDGSNWSLVLDVNKSVEELTITNYGEYYYGFAEAVDYGYFKLIVEDASGAATPKYQFSEINLFTDKK